uniref:Enolase 3 n=1 Tax=Felis catus TaxID=9685 RepID=A0ABI8APW7_FELCA
MAMQKIFTWEILDSRDNPMVDVVLHMARGQFQAAVPSRASTGIYETLKLRDGDKSCGHQGKEWEGCHQSGQ